MALPLILASVSRVDRLPSGEPAEYDLPRRSFREWAAGSFGTWSGRLRGSQAMTQALLPFAAAAFGMTVFGILLHVAERAGT